MTHRAPDLMAAWNGPSAGSFRVVAVSRTSLVTSVLGTTLPSPGKCFTTGGHTGIFHAIGKGIAQQRDVGWVVAVLPLEMADGGALEGANCGWSLYPRPARGSR